MEVKTLRHFGTKRNQGDLQSNTKTLRNLETPKTLWNIKTNRGQYLENGGDEEEGEGAADLLLVLLQGQGPEAAGGGGGLQLQGGRR